MQLLVWALPVLGATLIITCSALLRPARQAVADIPLLRKLVICPMCAGWWVGVVASWLGWSLVALSGLKYHPALMAFGDGCAASYACWTSHVLLCAFGQGKLLTGRVD